MSKHQLQLSVDQNKDHTPFWVSGRTLTHTETVFKLLVRFQEIIFYVPKERNIQKCNYPEHLSKGENGSCFKM